VGGPVGARARGASGTAPPLPPGRAGVRGGGGGCALAEPGCEGGGRAGGSRGRAGGRKGAIERPAVACLQAPHQPAQPFKFTISESCDRIKEEFQFLQAQYHSLKLECEKLASEKTEMQRHYVMYYEMSYGLNIEMHKQDLDMRNHLP
uniref:Groucho/TLE N-terminal Q-rich domain-containing protein n=1 Tax=Accipiter nisus TaxID=211598 RepID=A0A8B9MN75_9AVES